MSENTSFSAGRLLSLMWNLLEIRMCSRKLKGNSLKSVGRLQWQQYQPHGTLQMVNRPVTIGTINDYMHERNGQKQDHLQRAHPRGPKARGVVMLKQGGLWGRLCPCCVRDCRSRVGGWDDHDDDHDYDDDGIIWVAGWHQPKCPWTVPSYISKWVSASWRGWRKKYFERADIISGLTEK